MWNERDRGLRISLVNKCCLKQSAIAPHKKKREMKEWMGVGTWVITNIRRNNKHPDVFLSDQRKRKITLIKVEMT